MRETKVAYNWPLSFCYAYGQGRLYKINLQGNLPHTMLKKANFMAKKASIVTKPPYRQRGAPK